MQTTQKELIFKIIDSLMKYIVKQAFLLDFISKIPACVCWFAFSAGSKLIFSWLNYPTASS